MKAAGSIHDDDILAAIDSRVDGVERNRGRIRARFAADEIGTCARGPFPQLVYRPSTKGVGRADEDRHLIRLQKVRELPDEGRLAGAVHPDHEHHRRPRRRPE